LKKRISFKWLMLLAFLFYACAHQPPPPPDWRGEKEAIHLRVRADSQLNLHEDIPHALVLCIYQLRSKTTFNYLTDEIDGRYRLLECEVFDASVVNAKRLILQPGEDMTLLMDRSWGAKHLAFVAGYFLLQKRRIIRVVDFPVIVEKKGFGGQKTTVRVGELKLELVLGAQQIDRIEKK
jgi:type VI secretion system VasD/TssJ family lipoprotein